MEDTRVATGSRICNNDPTVGGHDVPYTEIGVYRSSLNLLSAAVEDEGGNLDSTNGEGNEIANNMSHLHGGGEG
jgi:hypothetical protein